MDKKDIEIYCLFHKTDKKVLIFEEEIEIREGEKEAYWHMPMFFSEKAAKTYLKNINNKEYIAKRCVVFAEPISLDQYEKERNPVKSN